MVALRMSVLFLAAAAFAGAAPPAAPKPEAAGPLSGSAREQTLKFVLSLQNEDGGFGSAPGRPSDSASTSGAARTLKLLGAAPRDAASARQFLWSCCHEGSLAPGPGADATPASTAIGLMGVVAILGRDDPAAKLLAEESVGWLEHNTRTYEEVRIAVAGAAEAGRLPSDATLKSWSEICRREMTLSAKTADDAALARTLGGAAVALMRLGVKPTELAWVRATLDKTQTADGGWKRDARADGPDLETSYRVMRAYHMLGAAPPQVSRLREWIAACRDKSGGYGVSPGQPPTASGTYFAVTLLSWLPKE